MFLPPFLSRFGSNLKHPLPHQGSINFFPRPPRAASALPVSFLISSTLSLRHTCSPQRFPPQSTFLLRISSPSWQRMRTPPLLPSPAYRNSFRSGVQETPIGCRILTLAGSTAPGKAYLLSNACLRLSMRPSPCMQHASSTKNSGKSHPYVQAAQTSPWQQTLT